MLNIVHKTQITTDRHDCLSWCHSHSYMVIVEIQKQVGWCYARASRRLPVNNQGTSFTRDSLSKTGSRKWNRVNMSSQLWILFARCKKCSSAYVDRVKLFS